LCAPRGVRQVVSRAAPRPAYCSAATAAGRYPARFAPAPAPPVAPLPLGPALHASKKEKRLALVESPSRAQRGGDLPAEDRSVQVSMSPSSPVRNVLELHDVRVSETVLVHEDRFPHLVRVGTDRRIARKRVNAALIVAVQTATGRPVSQNVRADTPRPCRRRGRYRRHRHNYKTHFSVAGKVSESRGVEAA
jgi:hypothetical protein